VSVKHLEGEVDDDFNKVADRWGVERKPGTRRFLAEYGYRFNLHQLFNLLKAARRMSVVRPIELEHLRAVVALTNPGRLPVLDDATINTDRKECRVSVKINLSSLTNQQIVEVVNHLLELDGIRAVAENLLANSLLQHPDVTPALAAIVTAWGEDCNTVTQRSEVEMARIVAPRPKRMN